jgi:hypothetical protein
MSSPVRAESSFPPSPALNRASSVSKSYRTGVAASTGFLALAEQTAGAESNLFAGHQF